MFISPDKILGLFGISQAAFSDLKEERAALRARLETLQSEVVTLRIASDWQRSKINQLELERAALLEKAYGLALPVPQIGRAAAPFNPFQNEALFEHIEDENVAKAMGLPPIEK